MKKVGLLIVLFVFIVGCSAQEDTFIGLTKAKELVVEKQAGEVIKAKSNLDEKDPYYEIEVSDEVQICEYRVDAKTGEVKLHQQRQHGNNQTTTPNEQQTTQPENGAGSGNGNGNMSQSNKPDGTITMKEAQDIAIQRVGGGTVVKSEWDFEDDYNTFVYEIEVRFGNYEYDIVIDAYNKTILEYQQDDID